MRRAKRGGHAVSAGSVLASSHQSKLKVAISKVHYLNRLYRMDFDRKSGTYRMLDNIMPDVSPKWYSLAMWR
jgi:hypothetical protein